MKLLYIVLIIALLGTAIYAGIFGRKKAKAKPVTIDSIYELTMNDIDGNPVNLDSYKGKVLLIVNVASKCGYTYQYEGLQALYETYQDQGLVILGFPANNFMNQEPGVEADIKSFCSLEYGVTFPMFSKISVKGADQHPLYTYLTSKDLHPETGGEISWNFNKFLIDREGKVVDRFGSKVKPRDAELVTAIEALL